MRKILLFTILSIFLLTATPTAVIAAECESSLSRFCVTEYLTLPDTLEDGKIKVNQGQSYFKDSQHSPLISFALRIVDFALKVIGPLAVLMIILAGVFMLISRGEAQNIDDAKDQITYAILGLIFAFMSYIIVVAIQSLFTTTA